jgi:hypothetical protein
VPLVTPIGPGAESVRISIYAADPDAGRWDRATWDGAPWAALAWQGVGCDVGEATYRWGASSEAGILSTAAAGELDLGTIDPRRELDPLNAASPYYGYVKPGTPVRISGVVPSGELPATTAFIDEASYDLASARGRIRAVDGIAYLAQAQLPDGAVLPNALRARVRAIVAAVGLGSIVPVEAEAPVDPDVDPPVAAHDGKSRPAWQAIADAALDALVYVWLDPTGTLRFRSWGSLPDAAFALGCPPPDADPTDEWLVGLSTIESTASADAIRNSIRAYNAPGAFGPAVVDGVSRGRYGPRPLDVERVVPDFATWAGRILADRADAGLEVGAGTIRPYTPAELEALLAGTLAGPSVVRIRDDAHGELVDLDVGMIGATVGITPAGWRWALVSMISRVDWEAIQPEPPEPPIPPPDPWHVEVRTYVASSDALIALTSGGAKYGAGASNSLPIGKWQGWSYRSLVKFPAIPWTKVRAIRTATLNIRTTTQVRVGFGSSPKTQVRRITAAWNAGASSAPSSGNAVVWPGPTTTATGAVTSSLPGGQGVDKAIRVDALVRAWAPASIGGSGTAQQGLALYEASGSESNTSEVWPVEQGGAARPSLVLELEIFD